MGRQRHWPDPLVSRTRTPRQPGHDDRRLEVEGRIGLSPALLNSLAIARGRDSPADLTPVMGCSPAVEDRPGGRVRAPSLAAVVDNGAYTDRVGYTHPTLRSGSARHLAARSAAIVRGGPGGVRGQVVDNGAFTGRVGYAHPTAAPGSARSPSILRT